VYFSLIVCNIGLRSCWHSLVVDKRFGLLIQLWLNYIFITTDSTVSCLKDILVLSDDWVLLTSVRSAFSILIHSFSDALFSISGVMG